MGSFAIDLAAMAFGMPRALFPVLAISVYHAGAEGKGLLYSAVSAGATVAALTTGLLTHARRLGRIVIVAVVCWGRGDRAGRADDVAVDRRCLPGAAGAADSVSAGVPLDDQPERDARCDARADVVGPSALVVTSGPRVGDVESGAVAALTSPRFSVVSGGLATIAAVRADRAGVPGARGLRRRPRVAALAVLRRVLEPRRLAERQLPARRRAVGRLVLLGLVLEGQLLGFLLGLGLAGARRSCAARRRWARGPASGAGAGRPARGPAARARPVAGRWSCAPPPAAVARRRARCAARCRRRRGTAPRASRRRCPSAGRSRRGCPWTSHPRAGRRSGRRRGTPPSRRPA